MTEKRRRDLFKELDPVTDAWTRGQYEEASAILEALWASIPLPKEATLNSFLAVRYGIVIAFKLNDLERATEWARRGLPYSGGLNLLGESEFLAGKVAFMRGDLGEALQYFKLVKKMSGLRLFKEEDPRFRKLLDEGVV